MDTTQLPHDLLGLSAVLLLLGLRHGFDAAPLAGMLFTAGLGSAERLSKNGFGLPELLPGALIVGMLFVAFGLTDPAARTGAASEGV